MNEGLNGWDGLFLFFVIIIPVLIVAAVLAAAALRLGVRDDYFDEPD